MKTILGLDIGTTSIGWAIVEAIDEKKINDVTGIAPETDINNERIGIYKDAVGVRIIAQDTEQFDKGKKLNDTKARTLTPTATRRKYRGSRRMKSRYKLRRDKLNKVLNAIGLTPDKQYYSDNETGKRGENNDIGKAIYELRDRAIREKITLAEWGRIILHLNQWRGYSSDRFAKEEKPKFDYFLAELLEVDKTNIVPILDENDKEVIKYYKVFTKLKFEESINIDDEVSSKITSEIEGYIFKKNIDFKVGDFITVKKPELKQDKKGKNIISKYYKFTITTPDPTDWNYKYQTLNKTLTEFCVDGGTVGSYFYHNFYDKNNIERIRNHVVNRSWYENEFDKIFELQFEYHYEHFAKLNILDILSKTFKDISVINEVKKKNGIKEQLKYLIKEKIIYYQRSWQQSKNKGECNFEKILVDKEITIKGENRKEKIKEYVGRTVIPKSHPLYQEFRIWQKINDAKLFLNTPQNKIDLFVNPDKYKIFSNKVDLFSNEDNLKKHLDFDIKTIKNNFFEDLNNKKSTTWNSFIEKELNIELSDEKGKTTKYYNIIDTETGEQIEGYFSVNFSKRKKDGTYKHTDIKGNCTKAAIQNLLNDTITKKWLNEIHPVSKKQQITNLQLLWEIIYDITNSDAIKVAHIINKQFGFAPEICKKLANLQFDDNGMGDISAKAIRQILPLMSSGKNITDKAKNKIDSVIQINNSEEERTKDEDEKLACFRNMITDKKTRLKLSKYSTIENFTYLSYTEATAVIYGSHSTKNIKPIGEITPVKRHSMNNPIVEKIVNETISIVNEIYKKYGFDEVRIELSRELRASMDERQQMWEAMGANAEKNEWAKQMLREIKEEFANLDTDTANNSNLDKIKIIEDTVKHRNAAEYKDKVKEYNLKEPTKAEINKYLHWLDQNFRCPYTDQLIPFTDVFSKEKRVEIEHIIPRERYYNNAYSNKVITWCEVNKEKSYHGNRTAYEFIVSKRANDIIKLYNYKEVELVKIEKWESHVKDMFPKGGKQANLLRKEIPDEPLNRTLNETQYINKKLKEKLSELVGNEKVWITSGAVTDILREKWHLNGIMRELMRDRFENFEIPTGKQTFQLRTIEEQKEFLNELNALLNSEFEFKVYKKKIGKKEFVFKSIDEINEISIELEKIINENNLRNPNKIQPYKYASTEDATELKNLTYFTKQIHNKTRELVDVEIFEGFSKRLDHRHHAIDAIIIACTKQNHIQYINTLNAINTVDTENDDKKKMKYKLLKNEICTGNSSTKYKTPWIEDKFITDVKNIMNEVIISHKNTRLLISPSKHKKQNTDNLQKVASIRGELHQETNYAKKNYFDGSSTPIIKLIPLILKLKFENQNQTMVFPKSFSDIIRETVLKEKYQDILILLFAPFEKLQLNDSLCKEKSKLILSEIQHKKLLIDSKTKKPIEWLSVYAEKDKSCRPNGLVMNFNDPKEIKDIADPRIKRLANYRLEYVKTKKAAIDNLGLDKKEKDLEKRKIESLKLYCNAIYEVRIKKDNNAFNWVELKNIQDTDIDKIEYNNKQYTELIKNKLKAKLATLKETYFDNPVCISNKLIEVKKIRQIAYFQNLYQFANGRFVNSMDAFMVYFFGEKTLDNHTSIKREVKFLKFLDAVRIISAEKPNIIDYNKLLNIDKNAKDIQKNIEYDLLFTLAKNDLVYLPDTSLTKEQLKEIDWNNKQLIIPNLYIVKDMNPSQEKIIFQKIYISDSIKIKETEAKLLFKNTDLKEQVEEIKYGTVPMLQSCIKVFTDKLGKVVVPYWEFPNGCWDNKRAVELGLILTNKNG